MQTFNTASPQKEFTIPERHTFIQNLKVSAQSELWFNSNFICALNPSDDYFTTVFANRYAITLRSNYDFVVTYTPVNFGPNCEEYLITSLARRSNKLFASGKEIHYSVKNHSPSVTSCPFLQELTPPVNNSEQGCQQTVKIVLGDALTDASKAADVFTFAPDCKSKKNKRAKKMTKATDESVSTLSKLFEKLGDVISTDEDTTQNPRNIDDKLGDTPASTSTEMKTTLSNHPYCMPIDPSCHGKLLGVKLTKLGN